MSKYDRKIIKKLPENHKKYDFSDRMWRKEWDSNPR